MSKAPDEENQQQVPVPDLLAQELQAEEMAHEEENALARQQNLARTTLNFNIEQAARKIMDYGTRSLMIAIFGSVVISVFVFVWHVLAPECWGWLSEENLLILKSFVFSGAVLGAASNFFRKYA